MKRPFLIDMPGNSFSGPQKELSEEELSLCEDLHNHVKILSLDIGERNIWHPHELTKAYQYIEQYLSHLNYKITSQEFNTEEKRVKNLIAEKIGKNLADEIVIIGAHYDSLIGTSGANDNGSGVAALLELARIFAGETFERTIRFAAFVNEEPPFFQTGNMGSWMYAKSCRSENDNIVAMFSLETIGFYSDLPGSQKYPFPLGLSYPDTGNFIAFVSNTGSQDLLKKSIAIFRKYATVPSEGIAAPQWLPGIGWSDQWAFWKENYPALMITDTAPFRYPYYHTAYDLPDKLNYSEFSRSVHAFSRMIVDLINASG